MSKNDEVPQEIRDFAEKYAGKIVAARRRWDTYESDVGPKITGRLVGYNKNGVAVEAFADGFVDNKPVFNEALPIDTIWPHYYGSVWYFTCKARANIVYELKDVRPIID